MLFDITLLSLPSLTLLQPREYAEHQSLGFLFVCFLGCRSKPVRCKVCNKRTSFSRLATLSLVVRSRCLCHPRKIYHLSRITFQMCGLHIPKGVLSSQVFCHECFCDCKDYFENPVLICFNIINMHGILFTMTFDKSKRDFVKNVYQKRKYTVLVKDLWSKIS